MLEAVGDEALIMLVKESQERQAVSELVKRYKKQAYLLALRLAGSHDDAMDASQEAFVRLYKKASSYQSGRSFRPWFFRNEYFDRYESHVFSKIERVSVGSYYPLVPFF